VRQAFLLPNPLLLCLQKKKPYRAGPFRKQKIPLPRQKRPMYLPKQKISMYLPRQKRPLQEKKMLDPQMRSSLPRISPWRPRIPNPV
jgi:hypothetical protein